MTTLHLHRPRRTPWLCMVLWLGAAAAVTTPAAWAGQHGGYSYGEAWWREYTGDPETVLLLHFGRPQTSSETKLARKVQEQKKEDDITLLLDDDAPSGDGTLPEGVKFKGLEKKVTVDDSTLKAGELQDYGVHRRRFKLATGYKTDPQGRFGEALRCDGRAGMSVRGLKSARTHMLECWLKVEAWPEKPACVWSINNDEGRLLLHPDGLLELRIKRPFGTPSEKSNTPERYKIITSQILTYKSKSPVELGQWVHAAAYTFTQSVPGNPPFVVGLKVNGQTVAEYQSEPDNTYNFLSHSRKAFHLSLGNNFENTEGFRGLIDEVRLSGNMRTLYGRPVMPWRDATAARALQFDEPVFLENGTVFHASLDKGLAYDFHKGGADKIGLGVRAEDLKALAIDGVRGQGWVVRPDVGYPKFSMQGMNALEGTLEFWFQPLNWDDVTGYWIHTPPAARWLNSVRFVGARADGKPVTFMSVSFERAHNLERRRVPYEPGRWHHVLIRWDAKHPTRAAVYRNGRPAGTIKRVDLATLKALKPTHVEIGITNKCKVKWDEKPALAIDEVVGYAYPLSGQEVKQAFARVQRTLKELPRYESTEEYQWSISRLICGARFFPRGESTAVRARISVLGETGEEVLYGPMETALKDQSGKCTVSRGTPLKPGKYRIRYEGLDEAGKVLVTGDKPWELQLEPWRNSRAGIIDAAPAPWTPVELTQSEARTRMTTWKLTAEGLPAQIVAAGEPLLAAPMRLLEDGKPMKGVAFKVQPSRNVEAGWSARFDGTTCEVELAATVEYDGLLKWSLSIKPKTEGQKVAPLTLEMPLHAARATHGMYNVAGRAGAYTFLVDPKNEKTDGTAFTSRRPGYGRAVYEAKRKKQPVPAFDTYKAYAFLTQLDLNDLERGVYWFADNARGWGQSPTVDTHEVIRKGDTVLVRMNLVAEATTLTGPEPIVFGMLPHPARPMPEKYRLYDRVSPEVDAHVCSMYGNVDVFQGMTQIPRSGEMNIYPEPDPDNPKDWAASWAHAETKGKKLRIERPYGLMTMYLSRYWFSCRYGAYDNWEWRSGHGGRAIMTQSFVDYLTWEMNEWIKRGIYDAIYLDECYDLTSNSVDAGFAIKLPDGSVQPGQALWGFRDLIKRWRNIFHAHGREPMILIHLTGSFQYAGLVFCDSYLDGENRPIIKAGGGDFVDKVPLRRAEVIQNGSLWGLSSFYMPAVWEKGFGDKEANPHTRWSWRMARGVNSLLAHFEVGCTYTAQGASVYKKYWDDLFGWGAGDAAVPFHPYFANSKYLKAEGQGDKALVSFYRKDGKLLLIASNRERKDREIRVTLDRAALKLPAKLKVRMLDTGHAPDPGTDIMNKSDVAKEVKGAMKFDLDGETDEVNAGALLDDLEQDLSGKAAKTTGPHFEGEVLVLPVRGRDYLMVVIEP